MKAFKPGIKLRIPAAGSSSSSSLLASNRVEVSWPEGGNHVKKPKKSKPWTIRLVARSGGREDPGNVFGQLDDAEEGLDFHDLKETPPFDTSYFSILFTNPLFGAVDWGYTSEFRPVSKRPEGEWPFVVKASQDIGEITLHWEGEDYLFEDA